MGASVGGHASVHATSAVVSIDLPAVTTLPIGSTFYVGHIADTPNNQRAPTDNKGNTFGALQSPVLDGTAALTSATFYIENGVGGASHVVTVLSESGGASHVMSACFVEIVGGRTSGIVDQNPAGARDTSSPYTVTTGTQAQGDNIAITFCFPINNAGTTEVLDWSGSGFTQIDHEADNNFMTSGTAYKLLQSTAAVTVSVTTSGVTTVEAINFVTTFKSLPLPDVISTKTLGPGTYQPPMGGLF